MEVTGFSRSPQPPNLEPVKWIQGDVVNFEEIKKAVTGCDAVVHLACLPLNVSQQQPLLAFEVNTLGTARLLEAVHQAGVARLIFSSTGQVYGPQKILPNREDHTPNPSGEYAVSKYLAEQWCQIYSRKGLNITILRLFNVYGLAFDLSPRPTVETFFLRQVLEGHAPAIRSHPDESRDFIHVQDVIRAFQLAVTREVPATFDIFNIGSGDLCTLYDLACNVLEICESGLKPVIEPQSGLIPTQYQADLLLSEKALGFSPRITLREGLTGIYQKMQNAW